VVLPGKYKIVPKVKTITDRAVSDRRGLRWHAPSSVIGKTPRILQGPGTDEKVIAKLSNALKSGAKFEGKAINYKKDGTPFIMYWRVLPIKVGKRITAWVAIQREASVI
jgi:hypothetical protein